MSSVTEKLRAWWFHKQGLDGRWAGASAAEILTRSGWMRSVGGAAPYLGLFARGGLPRTAVDEEVASLRIHELPSARGCTHVLPAADFALGLRAGRGFADEATRKSALRVGVTEQEIDTLKTQVLGALAKGPLDPAELRERLPVRSLGEAGRKVGVSTPLPVALGLLQQTGEIRRIPVNGRLDQERYRYARWTPNPLDGYAKETFTELARRYFAWIGPASLKEFQWFSGLGVKASAAAVAPLGLLDVGEGRLLLPEERAAFEAFRVPATPQYAVVSSLDGLALLRRNLVDLMNAEDRTRPVGGLSDLPSHAIFDRGRLVGLWEFDVADGTIAWAVFQPADRALRACVERTAEFVRWELGDARAFSLDSPKARAPRVAALRAEGV